MAVCVMSDEVCDVIEYEVDQLLGFLQNETARFG